MISFIKIGNKNNNVLSYQFNNWHFYILSKGNNCKFFLTELFFLEDFGFLQ